MARASACSTLLCVAVEIDRSLVRHPRRRDREVVAVIRPAALNRPDNNPSSASSPSAPIGNPMNVVALRKPPIAESRTVATTMPTRRPNAEIRTREHLTEQEVERLMDAARAGRWGHRDATMVLMAYRHGLRAAELVDLRWDQVDFTGAVLHVRRVKRGTPATHPLSGLELRALRRLQRESEGSPFVFVSERGAPFTTSGFSKLIKRAAEKAGLEIKAHPHMLRHACGFKLANAGHDTRALQAYLGHRNIQHTVRYTELAPNRFKTFWQD
jgi:integrase